MKEYKGKNLEFDGQTLFIGYQLEYAGKTVLSGINRKAERPMPIWLEIDPDVEQKEERSNCFEHKESGERAESRGNGKFRLISSPQEIHVLQLFVMNEMIQKGEIPENFFQKPDPEDKIVGKWISSIQFWKKEKKHTDAMILNLRENGTYEMTWQPEMIPGEFALERVREAFRKAESDRRLVTGRWRKLDDHLQRVKKPDPYANRDYRLMAEADAPYGKVPVAAVLHKSLITHKPALTVTFYSAEGMEETLQVTFYRPDMV